MCKFDDLKKAASPILSEVCRKLPRNHERGQAREIIRTVLDKHEMIPGDSRFVADWMMGQLGYGGGF